MARVLVRTSQLSQQHPHLPSTFLFSIFLELAMALPRLLPLPRPLLVEQWMIVVLGADDLNAYIPLLSYTRRLQALLTG